MSRLKLCLRERFWWRKLKMKKPKGYSRNIPKLPGIYKLTNLVDGKIYIGKSVNLKFRMLSHGGDQRSVCYVSRAIRKHGWINFKFEFLEIYPKRTGFIEKYILEREMFWIQFFRSNKREIGYNLINPLPGREGGTISEKQRETLRKRYESPEYVAKRQKRKEEKERKKILSKQRFIEFRKTQVGPKAPTWGKKHSEETKRKISISNSLTKKGCDGSVHRNRIDQFCAKTKRFIKTWDSLSEAALFFKINPGAISKCLTGLRKSFIGFIWKYHVKKLLICGVSGAGKSTLSKLLIEKYPQWDWVNGDSVREAVKNYDFSEKGRLKQANSLARYCQKSKKEFVICDAICPLRRCRKKINADAMIFLNEESRCQFKDTLEMFEKPTSDECGFFLKIDGDPLDSLSEIDLFIQEFLSSVTN